MAIDKLVAPETLPALSWTVTVKVNGLSTVVVGVPLMTPVVAFSVRPGGRLPEATVQFW